MMQLTIIGFGNQAKAWAQNLRDSGFPVKVALRPQSSSHALAHRMGFQVIEVGSKDFFEGEAFALLTPDQSHFEFMQEYGLRFKNESVIIYAHGYSLLKFKFDKNFPKISHLLFAPKAIGSELRKQFEIKGKLGAVYSLEHIHENTQAIEKWMKKLAVCLGINMGPFKTTFQNETHADLYSEQGLLCSLIPYTAGEMFKHLVEKGIEPELAYFECWHELKLIVNAMVDKGPEGFFDLISPNALIGSEKGYKKLITKEFQTNLQSLLGDILDGTFDREIDSSDVQKTRKIIQSRWSQTPLMKTFKDINQDQV